MRFQIKAFRMPGGLCTLDIEASNLADAKLETMARGYQFIGISQKPVVSILTWSGTQKFNSQLFCQELLSLLEAGMSLVEVVDLLARKAKPGEPSRILEHLARQLGEGKSFAKALEAAPSSFPVVLTATVRAAGLTGNLAEALRRYLAYQRQLNAVRDKMLAAAVYPALLVVIGLLVIGFLLGYVVPRFAKVYEDVGRDHLPLLSRWLMHWGQVIGEHIGLVGIILALLLGAIGYGLTRSAVRVRLTQILWQFPALGEQLRIYQLARFTRTIAMLLKGGIPLVTALDMADTLLRQPALHAGLEGTRQDICEGRAVSDAFQRHGLATEVGTRLLVVGERSGELGDMMERIAVFYDDQISRAVDWASRLFEPILMLAIGFLIGGIVILMYLPIFELAGNL